jgi:hypothetical protein
MNNPNHCPIVVFRDTKNKIIDAIDHRLSILSNSSSESSPDLNRDISTAMNELNQLRNYIKGMVLYSPKYILGEIKVTDSKGILQDEVYVGVDFADPTKTVLINNIKTPNKKDEV